MCGSDFILPLAYACYENGGNLKGISKDSHRLEQIMDELVANYDTLMENGNKYNFMKNI